MTRLPDWDARFVAFLAGLGPPLHVYGARDCALLGADCVLAVTGVDPAAEFRGKYSTEAGAAKALRTIGAGDLASTVSSKFESIAPSLAGRADLVLHKGNLGFALGDGTALFLGEDEAGNIGWLKFPRSAWEAAWRV